jgi:hypothetical protein
MHSHKLIQFFVGLSLYTFTGNGNIDKYSDVLSREPWSWISLHQCCRAEAGAASFSRSRSRNAMRLRQ